MIKTKLDGANVYCLYDFSAALPAMVVYRLGFTGHRDWYAQGRYLAHLWQTYPGAVWVHGDAYHGFDAQVRQAADVCYIAQEKHPPDYAAFPDRPRYAPIHRNRSKIVETVDALVGLWDGRESGGTYDTLCYADERNLPIILLQPYERVKK